MLGCEEPLLFVLYRAALKLEDELDLASMISPLLGDLKNELKFDCLLQNFVIFFLGSDCSLFTRITHTPVS